MANVFEEVNFVTKRHPMARCVPETFQSGWQPGMVRNYVIVPNPQSKEIIGKGPSVDLAWANASAILKGLKVEATVPTKPNASTLSNPVRPIPGSVTVTDTSTSKKDKEVEEWNSRKKFEEWASFHWNADKTSVFMKHDSQHAGKYLQDKVQSAWEGWQAREALIPVPKKRKKV